MKNWMQRLALLTILGALVSSAALMGCGGGDDDVTAVGTPTPIGGAATGTQ